MSSFNKLFSFSGGHSKDKDKDDDQHEERKSRSLFSSLTGGGSSSTPASSSSMRSPSPYAGRQSYKSNGSGTKDQKHRHHRRPWKRHSRRESQSQSEHEYAGATSSANVSEAESDTEAVLSRLASNSSSGTASSTATSAANTSGGIAPLSSSTSSNASRTPETSPKAARTVNRTRLTAVNAGNPQAGKGAPRNAYYDSDDGEAGDDDSDDEHQSRTSTTAANTGPSSLLSPDSARSRSSGTGASSSANEYGIRGLRVVDPTSDSEYEDHDYTRGSDTDDGDEYYSNDDDDDMDPTVLANTEANAGSLTAAELLATKPALLAGYGDDDPDAIYYNDDTEGPQANWPNLVKSPASPFDPLPSARVASGGPSVSFGGSTVSSGTNTPTGTTRAGRGRGGTIKSEIPLIATRPKYERNRCSITLTHGDPNSYVQVPGNVTLLENDQQANSATPASYEDRNNKTAQGTRKKRRGKTYVVASDLSEESYYAIEWAIGTVLRSGDELLFVTVMETDSKRKFLPY